MFRNLVARLAIKYAMRRPAPASIPLSLPRAAENNFYSIDLYGSDGGRVLWVRSSTWSTVSGLVFSGEDSREDSIEYSSDYFKGMSLKVDFYYKGYQFSFSSPFWFLCSCLLGLYRVQIILEKVEQGVFNRKSLALHERMELLQWMVNRAVDDREETFSPLSIGTEINSERWWGHPDRRMQMNYTRLLLESLANSGELIAVDMGAYRISPRAVATLDEYERMMQMHQDSLRNSRMANRLAFVVALVTVVGVLVDLISDDDKKLISDAIMSFLGFR